MQHRLVILVLILFISYIRQIVDQSPKPFKSQKMALWYLLDQKKSIIFLRPSLNMGQYNVHFSTQANEHEMQFSRLTFLMNLFIFRERLYNFNA